MAATSRSVFTDPDLPTSSAFPTCRRHALHHLWHLINVFAVSPDRFQLCYRAGLSLHSATIDATRRLMPLGYYLSSRLCLAFSPQVSGKLFLVL
jgi:hypothetical protein